MSQPQTEPAEAPPPSRRKSWAEALYTYTRPRILLMLALGFASGLPLALTGGTLSLWLSQNGIEKSTIGMFTWVTVPYGINFLWAPLIDRLPVPGLRRWLGQRRSWLLIVQLALSAAILALGTADPTASIKTVAVLAVIVASLSATQDVIIDGYRVTLLDDHEQGHGSATAVLGYRLGMMASGAGALFIVGSGGWFWAYATMAGAMLMIGCVATLIAPRGQAPEVDTSVGFGTWLKQALLEPLLDFTSRKHWYWLLLFIALFRLCDILVSSMSMPFYNELGFTPAEIASITKLLGVGAAIVGGLVGGVLMSKLGLWKGLIICGVLQLVSNLGFVWLASVGHEIDALAVVIVLENLAAGMGTTALVMLLSRLCNVRFAATQYALLASLSGLGARTVSQFSGFWAESLGWQGYFLLTAGFAVPGLALLVWLMRDPPPMRHLEGEGDDEVPGKPGSGTRPDDDVDPSAEPSLA